MSLTLILIGAALLAGFAAHALGRATHIPRVSLMLLAGVLAGPSALDLIPADTRAWFPLVSQAALSMVGFLLGRHFRIRRLRHSGATVLIASITGAVVPAVFVLVVLLAIGWSLTEALLVAAVAAATDPAATTDVARENHARGPVTETAEGVVALDDVWAVILFSLLAAAAEISSRGSASVELLIAPVVELGGGVALGALLGLPVTFLSGRLRRGQVHFVELLGFVFLASGIASHLHLSYLVTSMTMGAVVANLSRHSRADFVEVESGMLPWLIFFFLLAGASFRVDALLAIPVGTVAYLIARSAGKIAGARFGVRLAKGSAPVGRYLGWCLLPQGGLALGMALLLVERFGEQGARALSLLVAATILFEVLGPLAARSALRRAGELHPVRRQRS